MKFNLWCWLGWHKIKEKDIAFDGCENHAICSRCGKICVMDNKGVWA